MESKQDTELVFLYAKLKREKSLEIYHLLAERIYDYLFPKALKMVFGRYNPPKEYAHELVARVLEKFGEYFDTIENEDRLPAWLSKVLRNEFYQDRRETREISTDPEHFEEKLVDEKTPGDILADKDAIQHLREVLNRACSTLTDKELDCTRLIFFENKSASEAAENLGVTVETIHTYTYRAKAKLENNEELREYLWMIKFEQK